MLNFLAVENLRIRYWWPALIFLAGFTYLYSLGSVHIPNIGDEAPYFQLTRLTAENGKWLPLRATAGLENTKPPLLFWQGIISTNWGKNWGTIYLRLPIVLFTFLTAFLVFSLGKRMSGLTETGYVAALGFLGFSSTFQHGRPFLTNMPETFFMFLVFYLLLRFRMLELRRSFWICAGILIGIGSLYRSFAVIAPIALALGWYLWWQRRWHLIETIRRDSWKPTVVVVIALACFALWPLLDPAPGQIFQNFFLKENVGKIGGGNYLQGLFAGSYPIYRIWFGAVTNAGLLAAPVIYLAIVSFRQRRVLMNDEKALWILILSYLIVFSLPAQRQENYILPVMPAVAILLAMQWNRIDRRWFYLFNLIPFAALSIFAALMFVIATGAATSGHYSLWHPLVLAVGLIIFIVASVQRKFAREYFFAIIFLAYLGFSSLLAPFDGALGSYSNAAIARLSGKTIFVPTNFGAKYERHRFLIPGTDIQGYASDDSARRKALLNNGEIVAIRQRINEPVSESYIVYDSRLTLRSRLNSDELTRILLQQKTEVFIEREIIVQLKAVG